MYAKCLFEKCRMDKELLERKATNKRCLFRENYLHNFFSIL